MNIRKATEDDLSLLKEFEKKLVNFEMPFDKTLNTATTYYDIAELINPTTTLFLIVETDKPIGCGFFRNSWKTRLL